jgi:5-oxoprolinase (ATP-hydrolysing) subunit C
MPEAALEILRSGLGNTIQDCGRHGWLRFGVTPAGPMDWTMHWLASKMAGCPPSAAAAIEVTIGGIEIGVEGGPVSIAVAAPGFLVSLNRALASSLGRLTLSPGDRLTVRAGASGSWGYLLPSARIRLPKVMGSLATHTRSGLGGLEGRMLREGDKIQLADLRTQPDGSIARLPIAETSNLIRIVLGPQSDYFSERGLATLFGETFVLTTQMDRMAYWLDGPRIEHAKGFNIVSDGIAQGSIQVPGNGLPLILMADRQSTGGYPKIATVVRADLPRLAQLRTGARLTFTPVTVEEAGFALQEARRLLGTLAGEIVTSSRFISSETLLASNLVDGVVSGLDYLPAKSPDGNRNC